MPTQIDFPIFQHIGNSTDNVYPSLQVCLQVPVRIRRHNSQSDNNEKNNKEFPTTKFMAPPRLSDSPLYTVGLIAALDKELAAATAVLDEKHRKPANFKKHLKDTNTCTWMGSNRRAQCCHCVFGRWNLRHRIRSNDRLKHEHLSSAPSIWAHGRH